MSTPDIPSDTVEVVIYGSPGQWSWHKVYGRPPRDRNNLYVIPRKQYERWEAQQVSLRELQARIQRELGKVAKVNPHEQGFLVTREQIMGIRCRECGAGPGEYCTTRYSGKRAKDLHFYRKADAEDLHSGKRQAEDG